MEDPKNYNFLFRLWKYKKYVAALIVIAAFIGCVAYLSRQASNAEKEARRERKSATQNTASR